MVQKKKGCTRMPGIIFFITFFYQKTGILSLKLQSGEQTDNF